MSSPNNCAACDHKRHPDGGWCYMFRFEPVTTCARHTARTQPLRGFGVTIMAAGHARRWYVGADGVQRWADNDRPVSESAVQSPGSADGAATAELRP